MNNVVSELTRIREELENMTGLTTPTDISELSRIRLLISWLRGGMGDFDTVEFSTVAGQSAYIEPNLVGKLVLNVFTDGLIRPTSDYSFDSATGTVTLNGTIFDGVNVQVVYQNPVSSLEFTTVAGQNAYTFAALEDCAINQLFSDGVLRPTNTYSLDPNTGEITLTGTIYDGVQIVVNYKKT